MSLMDWLNMNLAVDIAFIIFAIASTWKMRKLQSCICKLESDLKMAIKNPSEARRRLKKEQK